MNPADSSTSLSQSTSPDCLLPPPRPVAPNLRANWLRASFLLGTVLGPLLVLWIGQSSSENLRILASQGKSTTGKIVARG